MNSQHAPTEGTPRPVFTPGLLPVTPPTTLAVAFNFLLLLLSFSGLSVTASSRLHLHMYNCYPTRSRTLEIPILFQSSIHSRCRLQLPPPPSLFPPILHDAIFTLQFVYVRNCYLTLHTSYHTWTFFLHISLPTPLSPSPFSASSTLSLYSPHRPSLYTLLPTCSVFCCSLHLHFVPTCDSSTDFLCFI